MKKFTMILTLVIASMVSIAQDIVYVTDLAGKIKSINANPVTGATTGNFTDVEDIPASAALGADANGWLYFLKYGNSATGEGDGKVKIYASRANGSGNETQIATADINGGSDNELSFVRLGVDHAGTAWILAAETGFNPKLYLAKFTCNGNAATNVTTISNNITVSDGNNNIFVNGDICFDGSGQMYALANDGNGKTKIYTLTPSSVQLNGAAVLNYRWSLKQMVAGLATNFSGQVGGCAFSSTGSMYISTTAGLYFIDQNTVNFAGNGTVQCEFAKTAGFILSDLATPYWPAQTRLPVKFISFNARAIGKGRIEVSFEVAESQTTNYFRVRLSFDGGRTFKTVLIQFPEPAKPRHKYTVVVKA